MAAAYWNRDSLGCIERDSFQLKPDMRTAMTTVDVSPVRSIKADVRAPLTARFTLNQSKGQFASFTQWCKFDLAGGAKPFYVDLWMWDRFRTVRARMHGPWKAQMVDSLNYRTSGVFEIERESIK